MSSMFRKKMKRILILLVMLSSLVGVQAQTEGLIRVVDEETGEAVPFAGCVFGTGGSGAATDAQGYVSIEGRGESVTVVCMGYETKTISVSSIEGKTIKLRKKVRAIGEVTVKAAVPEYVQNQMSKSTMPIDMITSLPAMTGEPDIMRALTLLPGVTQARDGYSDIVVRGADRGQSLILLDGIRVYNYNHFGGLISFVNTDVVKQVDIYKADFPARFGGMTSAVVEVVGKDGDASRHHLKASIGVTSSSLFAEGPIGDKLTYVVAGRGNYTGLFTILTKRRYDPSVFDSNSNSSSIGTEGYYNTTFWDVNARLRYKISDGASLSLTLFSGTDLSITDETDMYSNFRRRTIYETHDVSRGVAMTLTNVIGKAVWRNTVSLSHYKTNEDYDRRAKEKLVDTESKEVEKVHSDIKDVDVTSNVSFHLTRNSLMAGVEIVRSASRPASTEYSYEEYLKRQGETPILMGRTDTTAGKGYIKSAEMAIYVNNDWHITDRDVLSVGLRGVHYTAEKANHNSLEPRVGYKHLVGGRSSVKASYAMMRQFTHSIVNCNDGYESEIRLAASDRLAPQESQQVAVGYYFADDSRHLNVSAELYYKKLSSLLDYTACGDEARRNVVKFEEGIVTGGKGRAYGIEMQVNKDFRRVSCGVNYTLSRTERSFEQIEGGRWFKGNYDRTHDVSAHASVDFLEHWRVSSVFTMQTGVPCNVPIAMHQTSPMAFRYYIYGPRNEQRLPLYHKMDMSIRRSHMAKRGLRHEWVFGVSNLYCHANAMRVYYDWGELKQSSRIFVMPSLNYIIKI